MISIRLMIYCLGLVLSMTIAGCVRETGSPPQEPPPKAESQRKRGDVYLREGKYRAAMKQYMDAEKLDPNNPELKLMIGHVYANYYNRLDDAIRYFKQAIELKEHYSEAYNNLGTVYMRQERWDEAIAMFQKALDNLFYETPEFPYFNMARAYEEKGETGKAIEYYHTAIELRPNYIDPYIWLGLLYQREGRHDKALLAFRQARSILENRKLQKGKVKGKEWKAYLSALAGVCYHQALSFRKLGRFSEAREAYEKAIEFAPEEELRRKSQEALDSLPSQ